MIGRSIICDACGRFGESHAGNGHLIPTHTKMRYMLAEDGWVTGLPRSGDYCPICVARGYHLETIAEREARRSK